MDSDEQIIKSYLAGRDELLETLIKRYIDHIYNFVYRFVRDRGRAEDLTQETFIKVWKNIRKFDQKKNFKVWLFQIARNTALDFLRKRKEVVFSELEGEEGDFDMPGIEPLPEETLDRKELGKYLDEMMNELPVKYKAVLALYYQSQLNFREIGEISGESIDTVKSRHRRALALLKNKLSSR